MTSGKDVKLRRATHGDEAGLSAMFRILWPDCPAEEADALAAACCAGDGGRVAIVACAPSHVGFAYAQPRSVADGCSTSPVAYLEGLWVLPELRRTGVARRLVEEIETWASGNGMTELASDSLADNAASIAFHRALGFEEEPPVVQFHKTLDARRD